jgi:hypothetical protein
MAVGDNVVSISNLSDGQNFIYILSSERCLGVMTLYR